MNPSPSSVFGEGKESAPAEIMRAGHSLPPPSIWTCAVPAFGTRYRCPHPDDAGQTMKGRVDMIAHRRNILLLVTLAAAATPATGQTVAPAAGAASSGTHGAASIPDFSGIWRHPSLPGFEPPASGPGPVTNRSRRRGPRQPGASDYDKLVGDYANPILQPWAAEVVEKYGEISLRGVTFPNPANQCWPEPVPFIFKHCGMQMLQPPHQITMIYSEDHEVRRVRMNKPHPAQMTPSWYGDSVGHYEGDTLVIDTVGTRTDR